MASMQAGFAGPPQVLTQSPGLPQSWRKSEPRGEGRHVPIAIGWTHVWQISWQAVSQQTPSTQWPVAHSAAEVQV
jgi:hypothetical protein